MKCPYCGEELETKSNEKGDLGFFIDEKEKKLRCHDVNLDISSYRIS